MSIGKDTVPADQAAGLREQVRLVKSLKGCECPACAGPKSAGMSVCLGCWHMLPIQLRNALYRKVGRGYEPALYNAVRYLADKGVRHPTDDFTRSPLATGN